VHRLESAEKNVFKTHYRFGRGGKRATGLWTSEIKTLEKKKKKKVLGKGGVKIGVRGLNQKQEGGIEKA